MTYTIVIKKDKLTYSLFESEDYNSIWEEWIKDRSRGVIVYSESPLEKGYLFSNKYYVVYTGRKPAVYSDYDEAERQTDGVDGKPLMYKSYEEACLKWKSFEKINRREDTMTEVTRKSCGCCWYCGVSLTDNFKNRGLGEIDHQIPRSRQGGNELGNLVLSCRDCNNHQKSGNDVEGLRTKWMSSGRYQFADNDVVFFGELSSHQRHSHKRLAETGWQCPSTEDISCI